MYAVDVDLDTDSLGFRRNTRLIVVYSDADEKRIQTVARAHPRWAHLTRQERRRLTREIARALR